MLQAAWACGQPDHGLPDEVDALEGWIASAPHDFSLDRNNRRA
jgi:hypothetical protein